VATLTPIKDVFTSFKYALKKMASSSLSFTGQSRTMADFLTFLRATSSIVVVNCLHPKEDFIPESHDFAIEA
jgi:hypothetical protein